MKVKFAKDFSIGKYHWNHRVVRYEDGSLGIHEAHYSTPGAASGKCSITEYPVGVVSDDLEGLRWVLEHMLKALDKPILDYKTQEEEKKI